MRRGGNTLPARLRGNLYFYYSATILSLYVSDSCREYERGGEHTPCTISLKNGFLAAQCLS
jgi:hypothetical protein